MWACMECLCPCICLAVHVGVCVRECTVLRPWADARGLFFASCMGGSQNTDMSSETSSQIRVVPRDVRRGGGSHRERGRPIGRRGFTKER